MKQYQTGIQETVFEIIKQIKRKDINLPYITKQQITTEFQHIKPEINNTDEKIGQALYQLQKQSKFRRPRIKKYYSNKGIYLGWTLAEEEWAWK